MIRAFKWLVVTVFILAAVLVAAFFAWRGYAIDKVEQGRAIAGENGIDLLEKVEIGGVEQWISIRGEDRDNPVLLYLHGGPGTPMMPFSYLFQTSWEDHFVVVQWDQRGTGKTYFESDPEAVLATINFERMKEDALEVTQYLRQRLGKDKIILVGHSWGTMIGLPLAAEHPELYYAYVGTGQVISVHDNERLGYERALEEARKQNNEEAIAALEGIAPYPHPIEGTTGRRDILRHWQRELGLALASGRNYRMRVLMAALASPDYSLRDVSFFLMLPDDHKLTNVPALAREIDAFDVRAWGSSYDLPIFLIMGRNDWQTPSVLAEAYLENEVEAPHKAFVWVENAGHSVPTSQPDVFLQILLDEVLPVVQQAQ